MPATQTDSVARGGATIVLARVIGMGFAFLLFVLLARQSEVEAGVFRSVTTFLVIAEFLGLLGTQRWLVVAIAPPGAERSELFIAGCMLAAATALLIALFYLAIALSGIYGDDISLGIGLAALATLPAALLTNVQTALVGIGLSQRMGWLNLLENATRSLISIALVLLGMHVLTIVVVFVVCRWLATLTGLYMVMRELGGGIRMPPRETLHALLRQIPRFAVIMGSFLVIRNAALVMLPALVDEREVALFAVPYQLYDLALLIPTILAISSNFLFVSCADRGPGSLRWVVMQLWSLTSVFLMPVVMLSLVFGGDLLHALFGNRYDDSVLPFYLLMLAALLMALDQVLSQVMQSSRRFHEDTVAIASAAVLMLAGTATLGSAWGALGAALTFLVVMIYLVALRLAQLRRLIRPSLMLWLIWRQTVAALTVGTFLWLLRHRLLADLDWKVWAWLPPASLLAVTLYLLLLKRLGGMKPSKRARVRRFLTSRHQARVQSDTAEPAHV